MALRFVAPELLSSCELRCNLLQSTGQKKKIQWGCTARCDKLSGCRVAGRQSPAAVTSVWLSGSVRAACGDCVFLSVIGSHVSSKLLPCSSEQSRPLTYERRREKKKTDYQLLKTTNRTAMVVFLTVHSVFVCFYYISELLLREFEDFIGLRN